ncbi:hypothetical protein Mlaev_00640 [Microbacterium laevaniformans]|uniref:Major capsid protein n=1 Tax=Microbacterium laevaniformans TaxID=36807 RepID=A0A150HH30_9MICO|nr:hypothetical protein [Microbacterium laevaniformans]KXZ61381.1 hypothetical protein Mlaev_00640 [Microbacterium laevaniformans]
MHGIALSDITGADRGFNVGADVLTHTADGVPLASIYNEFVAALEEWNRGRDAISRLFTFDTTDAFAQMAKDPKGGPEFEEASEFGQPKSARANIDWMRMGFPLRWYDIGERYTRRFLRDVTAEQLEANHRAVFEADNRLLFRSTLSALTTKVVAANRPVTKPEGNTIYDLWDGSAGEVPPTFAGKTFDSTHSHYMVSGAATIDGGDLKELTDTIQEHGWGLRESGEQIVIMVRKGSTIANTIRTFRQDPTDATTLAKNPYDFIPSVAAPAYLTPENIQGNQAPGTWQGLPIFGSYGDAYLFESYWIPDGYAIALATSGAGSTRNPLAFRQHPNKASQGLRLVSDDGKAQYPLLNTYYERGFGVAVRNRSAAAVMQIKASGSYDNPTWP